MPDQTPFLDIVDEIVAMHNKKQQDYGTDGDPLARCDVDGNPLEVAA